LHFFNKKATYITQANIHQKLIPNQHTINSKQSTMFLSGFQKKTQKHRLKKSRTENRGCHPLILVIKHFILVKTFAYFPEVRTFATCFS